VAPLAGASRALELRLDTDQAGTLTLAWQITPDLDLAGHFVTVRDVAAGVALDMWSQTTYAVDVTPGVRLFRLELDSGREAPPVAFAQAVTTSEDTPVSVTLGAVDAQGRPLTYTIVDPAAHGTLLGTPPLLQYVPEADYHGPDAFRFVASNGQAQSNTATVSLTVVPVNDAPFAVPLSLEVAEDTPLPITLAATDADGDALSYTIVVPPAHGALNGTPPSVTYTPAPDYSGPDDFAFRASDGQLESATALVSISVTPVNDPPRVAFSVPGPAENVAAWTNNLASAHGGARIAAFSSQFSAGAPPSAAIDGSAGTRWTSASGQTTNQWLTVALPGAAPRSFDRVRIVNGIVTGQAVRSFEVRASTTGVADADFVTVLQGIALDNGLVQEFALSQPVSARYVQFLARDHYGSACCVSLSELEVVDSTQAGVPRAAAFSGARDAAGRPESLLDGSPTTAWVTPVGQTADQFVTLRLAGPYDPLVERVRIQPSNAASPEAIRDFELLVSTTTDDAAAFTPVLSGSVANDGTAQEFVLPQPVRARYVRLIARNNHGGASLRVATLEVRTAASEGHLLSALGSVAGVSSQSSGGQPERALDLDDSTAWLTASGQTADQWLTVLLPGAAPWIVDHVVLAGPSCCAGNYPREFELQVSTSTADASAFATAYAGVFRDERRVQHFRFGGVAARYVRLLVKNNHGGAFTGVESFHVYSPQIGLAGARFLERASDVDGRAEGFAWDFGDGGSSLDRDPAHQYVAPATYAVRLAATDDVGLAAAAVQDYQVVPAPQPGFGIAPASPGEAQLVTFTDTTVDAAGVGLREWSFGDGRTVTTTAATVTQVYADSGSYDVTLRVTSRRGASAVVAQAIAVANLPPSVNAGPDRRVRLGDNWGVVAIITDPSGPDRLSLQCAWDFGDGTSATGCGTPSHVYAAVGTYTATVTATDKDGAVAGDSVTVTVFPRECGLAGGAFVEYPFCGTHAIADLGSVPAAPIRYTGLTLKHDDPDTLLLAANANNPTAAIYSVGVTRGADGHITGFSGSARLFASVPHVDGGLVYGPGNVLFTARYPVNEIAQLKPGSTAIDKLISEAPLGINSISLNVVPPGFPGECSMKFVNFFTEQWSSGSLVPDGSGTYDVTSVSQRTTIFNGGPEHLIYVTAGTPSFTDRRTVLVAEHTLGNIVAYDVDGNGDPIPDTRRPFLTGYPGPEAFAFDPLTGDLLFSDLDGETIKQVRGFAAPSRSIGLAPAAASLPPGGEHAVTATVTDASGGGRPGARVTFRVMSGPNAGASGVCSPNPDCTTDVAGQVRFTYQDAGGAGTDQIVASFLADSCASVASAPASVAWVDNRPPVAADQAAATNEDEPVAVTLAATDPDGDALSYEVVSGPSHGALSGVAPDLTYTPAADYNSSDAFSFRVNDGQADSNLATISIAITPVNDPPVAQAQTVAATEDQPLAIELSGTDVDGDALSFVITTPPAHGSLAGVAPSLTYQPVADFSGADSFEFVVSDGQATSAPVAISVSVGAVNDPPAAQDASLTVAEDTPGTMTLSATDVDGDPLVYAVVAGPSHGTLSGAPPDLTYTPAPDYNGPDSVSFKASDGILDSNPATIAIAVNPVNDAPVAVSQSVTTVEDTSVAVTLFAADVDGDALSYVLVTPPVDGTLGGIAPNLTYTPGADENEPDSFTFKVNDGQLESPVATVTISISPVNDAPVAEDRALEVVAGQATPIRLAATDVDGDALSFAIVTGPGQGTLSGTPPDVVYTPATGYTGPDSFTFRAHDGQVESNLATVALSIVGEQNHAPACGAAQASVTTLWPPNHKLKPIQVVGVTDADGDPVTVRALKVEQDEPVGCGSGSGHHGPDATLSPLKVRAERQGGGNGRLYFITFEAADEHGASCQGTVTVCVPHDQHGPTCVDDGVRYDSTQAGHP
jgi:PKD repeat protein